MGILGTMTVSFAANIDGLKIGEIDHSISLEVARAALGMTNKKLGITNEKPKCLTVEQIAREVAIQFYEKSRNKHAT